MSSDDYKVVGITYVRDGKIFQAWPAPPELLERLETTGLHVLNGECTCGSPDFCDTYSGYRVRCFNVTADRCELFLTNDVC